MFVFPALASNVRAVHTAIDALPHDFKRLIVGPVEGLGYATVAVLPAGQTANYPHAEAFDAVHDALLAVTPSVEVLQARFGGDEDGAVVVDTTDTKVWVPHGAAILDPREQFGAPEELYEGAWTEVGFGFRARQMVRYFELLPDTHADKELGLSVSRDWSERLESDAPPSDDDLQALREATSRAGNSPREGVEMLITLMAEWQGFYRWPDIGPRSPS